MTKGGRRTWRDGRKLAYWVIRVWELTGLPPCRAETFADLTREEQLMLIAYAKLRDRESHGHP